MLILAALAAMVVVAPPHQAGEEFLLRLHPKAGAISRLHIEAHAERFDQPGTMDIDSIFKITYLEQVPKGHLFHWVVEKADTKGTGSMKQSASGGRQMAGREMDVVEDGRGKIINMGIGAFLDARVPNSSVTLPKDPVKVGDTWSDSFGNGSFRATFKLDRVVEEDGIREAVITASLPDVPGIQPTSPFTYWVDVKSGQLMKATGEMDMHQGPTHVSFHFKVSLL